MTGHTSLLRSFFNMNGTASRKRGWLVFGLCFGAMFIILGLSHALPATQRWLLPWIGLLNALVTVAVVQRLHDAGRSGYWSLLAAVPYLGVLVMITINALRPQPGVWAAPGHPWAQRFGYTALLLVALIFLMRGFVAVYWIPSGSMKPNLLVGDYFIVPFARAEDLQRGDVVVFRHTVNGSDFIKRLIGLPGDRVQMAGGLVVLNGEVLPQVDAAPFVEAFGPQGPAAHRPRCQQPMPAEGGDCLKQMARETLPGGRSYDVLNIDTDGFADTTEVFTVPPGHLFFLGDNRDNSADSRFPQDRGGLGLVPFENITGRVSRIVFSGAGDSLADVTQWRPGRYWKGVE